MRYSKLFLLPVVLLVLLAGLFLRVGSPNTAHAAPAVTCGQWNIISSPNPSTTFNDLFGVAAVSSNDVWAVGEAKNQNQINQTLTEHWNGTNWSVVHSPIPSNSRGSGLTAVTALSSNNVWAIGGYTNSSNAVPETLIEHWDGTAWSIIPSPNPGYAINDLYGIAALSPTDIWAVGSYSNLIGGRIFTLVEHWNGSAWSAGYAPANGLNAVTTTPSGTIWSVGNTQFQNSKTDTVIEEWKGTSGSIVPSPNVPGSSINELFTDTAISDNDIWAAGSSDKGTLTEHWDGTQWSIVPSPNPPSGIVPPSLSSLAALSSNNVWAVGTADPGALFEHWNGTQWSIVPGPDSASTALNGITSVPGTSDLWSVGFLSGTQSSQTLTEFYC